MNETFIDADGRNWRLAQITLGVAERMQAETGFDVFSLAEATDEASSLKITRRELLNAGRFVDVLFFLVTNEATNPGITRPELADAIHGESLQTALLAVRNAVGGFFGDPGGLPPLSPAGTPASVLTSSAGGVGSSPASPESTRGGSPSDRSS